MALDIYKEGTRRGLAISTSKGALTIVQLWTVALTVLVAAIREHKAALNEIEKEDNDLDFLEATSTTVQQADNNLQLKFDILKDIYVTRKAELDAQKVAADKKAHNAKIMELIAAKKEEALGNKSIEELEALLQK